MIPVILNPRARSQRAAGLAERLQRLHPDVRLCPTSGPGEAEELAADLAESGHGLVVAAGGDGTVNEVVNGLMRANARAAREGRVTTRLGILPVGTMNVFALEMGIPMPDIEQAWQVVMAGDSREVDVWSINDHRFVQLAGAGLDATIIQDTSWERKKALGPLSYVMTAAHALHQEAPVVTAELDSGEVLQGAVVLLGSGRYYGGPFPVFPDARNDDGRLDVVVFRRHGYMELFGFLRDVALQSYQYNSDISYRQTLSLKLTSAVEVPVEADGELIGSTPAEVRLDEQRLTVLAPPR